MKTQPQVKREKNEVPKMIQPFPVFFIKYKGAFHSRESGEFAAGE